MQAKTRVQVLELQHVKVRLGKEPGVQPDAVVTGCSAGSYWTGCFSTLMCTKGPVGPATCQCMHGVHCRCLAEVQKQMQVQQHLARLLCAVACLAAAVLQWKAAMRPGCCSRVCAAVI